MIAAAILQSAYNDLYKEIRNYIWDYDTVEKLADLETAVYMVFPDLDKVRNNLNKLRNDISSADVYEEGRELQKAFDRFEERLDGADAVYYGLQAPVEVINDVDTEIELTEEPDNTEGSDDSDQDAEREVEPSVEETEEVGPEEQ